MITTTAPGDWAGLQSAVCQILTECGFDADVEKTVETVRGKIELDVYAEEFVQGRKYVIACECKHWSARVTKTTVHSFRTVATDLGVNAGFIISTSGFQTGAYEAAKSSNISLVTWDEFQSAFEKTWLEKKFIPDVTERFDNYMTLVEPLPPQWVYQLPEDGFEQYDRLRQRYLPFAAILMTMTKHFQVLKPGVYPTLPLSATAVSSFLSDTDLPSEIVSAKGFREFYTAAADYCDDAVTKIEAIRDRFLGSSPA